MVMATRTAQGTFDVEMTPEGKDDRSDGNILGTAVVEKRFHGDLDGSGRGRMSSARTLVSGSAGYVMIERVRGTLDGRSGTFLLQHSGVLNRGAAEARIQVVPDSGTGDLTGMTGRLEIQIRNGQHEYTLRYTLPPAPSASADRATGRRARSRP
jgi:hypothetical protein